MSGDLRVFKFHETYETASWLEGYVTEQEGFYELAWGDEAVNRSMGKFSQVSILHHYIYSSVAVFNRRRYGKI
jgi:hypothetical protein